ncbi:hypothetical protein BCR36DRAFT_412561 [Piromyces finnis]|uniref:Uncharacterized protein n=1 Tax=Piromyces finnis TaxID=1754191 RepID=A0A1Y1V8W9_9FUNG|nr:hypothetical protein BCR36DRAFT_412561 [Piromyces finnis]|eukprot:ORX50073.1 hypothetical protein BCR36DRAFT_412561 [Piromyces finnis]
MVNKNEDINNTQTNKIKELNDNTNKVKELNDNKNKTKVYYNVKKPNKQQPVIPQEQTKTNSTSSNLNTTNTTLPGLPTNNPSNYQNNSKIITYNNKNQTFNMIEHTLIAICVAFFVLFLFGVTKRYYTNKKGKYYEKGNKKIIPEANGSKRALKNISKINDSANFPFKNKFGRKSRELIPSILMGSPAPLASLSDEALNSKFNESFSIDKDISINESIIQAQSYERNSMNFNDIKTLSWQQMNGYQYDINDISRCSTETNDVSRGNSINESNKLDNVVDVYFSSKKVDIMRQNSSSSCYSNIPDNSSSCGEPSLSRYIDNDSLLKYESSKCKLNMYNNNDYSSPNNGINHNTSLKAPTSYGNNRTSLQSSTIPSLSRFSIKNISSAIASRNNNDFNPSFSSNQKYYNKSRNSYSNFQSNNINLQNSLDIQKSHRYTLGANFSEEKEKLNPQNNLISNSINPVKQNNSTLSKSSSKVVNEKLKSSTSNPNMNANINDGNKISYSIEKVKKEKSNDFHSGSDSDSDSDSDLEEELENISTHEGGENNSKTINIDTLNNSNPNISVRIPHMSFKNSTQNELPTIIVNSQKNTPINPVETVYYRY